MKATSVGAYVRPVPTCCLSDRVGEVLERFDPAMGDRLIVVNAHYEPIGLLSAHTLLPFVWSTNLQAAVVVKSSLDSLIHTTVAVGRSLLSPLIMLPGHWSLQQVLAQVQSQLALACCMTEATTESGMEWVIVDDRGCYLGLLNWQALWHHWIAPAAPTPAVSPEPAAPVLASEILHALLQTLSQMPLPLMVQTQAGQVLMQNSGWQRLIDELQYPTQVAEQVAAGFSRAVGDNSYEAPASVSQAITAQAFVQPELLTLNSLPPQTSAPESDICICQCPTRANPEKVCQFTRIWLGVRAGGLPKTRDAPDRVMAIAPVQTPFQLAPFELPLATPLPPTLERVMVALSANQLKQADDLWIVLAQDVTEPEQPSKHISRELAAKELAAKNADLTQLNRLKDEFLACISHELKTPLTAVLGLSELLRDQSLGTLNDRQSRYAHLIYQSGRRLVSVVNDILDLTRIETGQLRLTPKSVTIRTVCEQAYQHLQTLHIDPEVTLFNEPSSSSRIAQPAFHLTIQPNLETIVADELRLRQMLTHLLSNALKFTDPAGEVGIRIERWEDWIAFTVWDTGIGIPADKQHLIFQKFQQLEQPMTRQFEGTGLGLVLTQRLAQLHGGDVTFVSAENEGSEFTLLLPPTPPQAVLDLGEWHDPQILTSVHRLPKSSNRLIVAVEADQTALNRLTQSLATLGYRVAIARSGMDALGKIRRLQPRAVVLNPMLPLLSGWDVLTLLKADACTRDIPVIITATPLEAEAAVENRADGFLSFPVELGNLEKALHRLIGTGNDKSKRPSPVTVLYLNPTPFPNWAIADRWVEAPISTNPPSEQPDTPQKLDLNRFLHPHFCRVLEVNDLDQAELLTRVWKPNLILLSNLVPEPIAYLKDLSQRHCLRALPIVTLTPAITEAAYQSGLSTFPCLMATAELEQGHVDCPDNSSLLQVLHIAAGIGQVHHILMADTTLAQGVGGDRSDSAALRVRPSNPAPDSSIRHLQASAQYLQAAGLNCSIPQTWPDVLCQLEHQTIDLLLLYLNLHQEQWSLHEAIQSLAPVAAQVPIVVWPTGYSWGQEAPEAVFLLKTLQPDLEAIATRILPPFASLDDVLAALQQTL
ncbi:MAG: ATP-binding protein [Synechococcales bacterium]|nr:ATP-binding protein [Synechococcales bacterium]